MTMAVCTYKYHTTMAMLRTGNTAADGWPPAGPPAAEDGSQANGGQAGQERAGQ